MEIKMEATEAKLTTYQGPFRGGKAKGRRYIQLWDAKGNHFQVFIPSKVYDKMIGREVDRLLKRKLKEKVKEIKHAMKQATRS